MLCTPAFDTLFVSLSVDFQKWPAFDMLRRLPIPWAIRESSCNVLS